MAERDKPLIALLAAPETSPSVLYGLYDVLYTVGAVYSDMTVGEPGPEALDVRIVAADKGPFRCMGNVVVEPHATLEEIGPVDAAVVCDVYTAIDKPLGNKYPREVAWLKKAYGEGALVCAVCSGSMLLAEAGLLEGQDAAAHWAYYDLFRRCYSAVRMRRDLALCVSGDDGRLVTAGASTAWQDLSLHLIGRFCGKTQAIKTSKIFLMPGHDDGQLPYSEMVRPIDRSDAVIGECQTWLAENYAAPNPVQRVTEHSGLSPRTFARRFRAATGYQPIDYVQSLRVEEAKQMLESEDVGVDEVAAAVGYEDPASFRRLFKRKSGLTPAAYRRKFQRIGSIGRQAN